MYAFVIPRSPQLCRTYIITRSTVIQQQQSAQSSVDAVMTESFQSINLRDILASVIFFVLAT